MSLVDMQMRSIGETVALSESDVPSYTFNTADKINCYCLRKRATFQKSQCAKCINRSNVKKNPRSLTDKKEKRFPISINISGAAKRWQKDDLIKRYGCAEEYSIGGALSTQFLHGDNPSSNNLKNDLPYLFRDGVDIFFRHTFFSASLGV